MKHYPKLEIQTRLPKTETKASALRKMNKLPGVIFGIGMKSIPIQIEWKKWQSVAEKGEKILDLKLDGDSRILAAIEEIARDPITQKILHISFHKLNEKKESIITVPIQLLGQVQKGVITHIINEVQIKGKPKDLPSHLEIDISNLKEGDHLTILDLKLPPGVKILEEHDKVFALCQRHKKIEEPVKVLESPTEVPLVKEEKSSEAEVIPLKQTTKKAS